MSWQHEGQDPDYRFSLANERTYLAWIRTALAILAGAIVLHQLLGKEPSRWFSVGGSLALSITSALLAVGAYRHWRDNEIAMRHGRPLPPSPLLVLLAAVVVIASVAATVFVLVKP